ncbi:MAG: hypothetical protein H6Q90_6483 [Deltaproteobacteria bacterium]|nr:hypothetical protein [Deltaproteobacteria bacterium]
MTWARCASRHRAEPLGVPGELQIGRLIEEVDPQRMRKLCLDPRRLAGARGPNKKLLPFGSFIDLAIT